MPWCYVNLFQVHKNVLDDPNIMNITTVQIKFPKGIVHIKYLKKLVYFLK